MIIFLAVMLTDIILLDFFNTVGLPTSTTVSIVFELLGAAVMMSLIKIISSGNDFALISDYINYSQAILIISGIFLSVFVAFFVGTFVQFFSRLILTFRYREKKIIIGTIWSGLAMTAMTYFLIFKGIKGASFVSPEFITWVKEEILFLFGCALALWMVIMHLYALRGGNVFKVIVLFGTFALAMAFAGNDLVNFIGVPIAGFESYLAWSSTGQDAFTFSMEILKEPVRTKSYLLVIAGLIMILTLWFSRKAQSVTETEVNLGRQNEGHERFTPNFLARGIVRYSIISSNVFQRIFPSKILNQTNNSFQPIVEEQDDKPAFDLIRAGVNLTTASILIAFATSLKLPLSTTYVSFMVAMGTSLADRAWGRDSAVYRVAGVLKVIGGWFATALVAFLVSGVFTFLIFNFQLVAIFSLVAMAVFFIYRSFVYHKKKVKKKEARVAFETNTDRIAFEGLINEISDRITQLLSSLKETYNRAFEGLINESPDQLDKAVDSIKQLVEKNEDLQYELFESIKRIEEKGSEGSRIILYIYDLEQDIVQSADLIVNSINQHLKNMLNPLAPNQVKKLEIIRKDVNQYFEGVSLFISQKGSLDKVQIQKKNLLILLEDSLKNQVQGIKEENYGARNSQLMFKILLETKDLIAIASRLIKLHNRSHVSNQEVTYYSFANQDKTNKED
jgi:phosphate/sulfate permease